MYYFICLAELELEVKKCN